MTTYRVGPYRARVSEFHWLLEDFDFVSESEGFDDFWDSELATHDYGCVFLPLEVDDMPGGLFRAECPLSPPGRRGRSPPGNGPDPPENSGG